MPALRIGMFASRSPEKVRELLLLVSFRLTIGARWLLDSAGEEAGVVEQLKLLNELQNRIIGRVLADQQERESYSDEDLGRMFEGSLATSIGPVFKEAIDWAVLQLETKAG